MYDRSLGMCGVKDDCQPTSVTRGVIEVLDNWSLSYESMIVEFLCFLRS